MEFFFEPGEEAAHARSTTRVVTFTESKRTSVGGNDLGWRSIIVFYGFFYDGFFYVGFVCPGSVHSGFVCSVYYCSFSIRPGFNYYG